MAALILRCQYKGGKRNVVKELTQNSTLQELQEKLWLLTDVPPHAQKILVGFPPRLLQHSGDDKVLSNVGIRSGDTLIVEEDKTVPRVIQTPPSLKADHCGQNKVLSRKIVPADNSCLFASISYLMFGDTSLAQELRKLTAECVSKDPSTYNNAFLGKSNHEYFEWILHPDHWGGGIEISILSKHYQTEIAVLDTQTGRIDRFGEDCNYKERIFLIYDGIHYDPLAVQQEDSSAPLQTIFSISDEKRQAEALNVAEQARKGGRFTDLSGFSLRCLSCGTPLVGQAAAQQHATNTGHINFGEY